ncbi:MAG TPA: hypothetical protein VK356_03505 [Thermomicrobiales bacterium]|nr:hypothetical protein [Thermomicrobiales bacterium]
MRGGFRSTLNETLPQAKVMRWGIGATLVVLTLSLVVPAASQPVEVVLTPLVPGGTPPPDATPSVDATPVERQVADPGGVSSRLLGQQAAAQATIASYARREATFIAREATQATRIVELEAALGAVQVTATALVQVAASTVLDPTRQSLILQTDLDGMINGDADTMAEARADLSRLLARYPPNCRAGFMLISGNAPSIDEGVELAQRVEALLREVSPTIFPEATAAELFALPEQPPFGQVGIDIFFYAGCRPTE